MGGRGSESNYLISISLFPAPSEGVSQMGIYNIIYKSSQDFFVENDQSRSIIEGAFSSARISS